MGMPTQYTAFSITIIIMHIASDLVDNDTYVHRRSNECILINTLSKFSYP